MSQGPNISQIAEASLLLSAANVALLILVVDSFVH